jgi:hypothetical protein
VLDEPDQLAGIAIRNGGGAGIHERERSLVGHRSVSNAPFRRGLPAGWLNSGWQMSACGGQVLARLQLLLRLWRRRLGPGGGRCNNDCDHQHGEPSSRPHCFTSSANELLSLERFRGRRHDSPFPGRTQADAGDQGLPRWNQMQCPVCHFPERKDQAAGCGNLMRGLAGAPVR